jgi:lipopolysaccharide/colanic/teichoic acid biosynthesis glycosyltransferase
MQRFARLATFLGSALAVAALAKYHAVGNGYDYTTSSRFAWTIAYTMLLWLAAYGAGVPDVRGRRRAVAAAVAAPSIAAVGISVVQLFVGDALLPRFVVFGAVVALVPWYLLCIAAASGGRLRAEERDRVLVVGDVGEAENLRLDLLIRPERPAQIVGAATVVEVGTHLDRIVAEMRASVLVLTREALADERLVHQAALLHEAGFRVRTLAMFSEEWLGKLPVSELERTSLLFDLRELHRAVYGRVTRLFDVLLSAIGGVGLLAIVPFVLLGNLVGNRGPLFYRQPRVGRNGVVFDILKFRTMRPDDGRPVNEWTSESDPRITPFGRLLRVSHLDELPQVLNILKGELSIVGPRPEQPHYVEELTEKIPFYNLRHLVRPGLTGWAQVKYGYAGNESDALEKLQYEFYYLRHHDLWFDLRIVGRTVRSVFGRRGR